VTAHLTQLTAGQFRVVGPSTTAPYGAQRSAIARVRDELEARFVIGGSLDASSPDGLFLELIDTRDGAHLWAIVAEPGDPTLAARAADSVAARLLGTGSASPH
jgi:TolB-like protein